MWDKRKMRRRLDQSPKASHFPWLFDTERWEEFIMKGKHSRYSTKRWWKPALAGICCFAVIAATLLPVIGNVWAQESSGSSYETETAAGTAASSETESTAPAEAPPESATEAPATTEAPAATTEAPATESSPQTDTDETQTEESEAPASDPNLQNNIDDAQTKLEDDKAVALEFPDEQTSTVEAALGYTIKGAHEEVSAPKSKSARMMLALTPQSVSNSDYRFDAYYVLYANNLATTKTDTVQDLTGNMSPAKQTIKYQLDFHNDTDYAVGEVVIRVPYSIYNDRNGDPVTPSDIGVPEAPAISSASSFNYTIDTDTNELVFTNCKPIPSGSNNLLQIFYAIDDMASVDSSIGSAGTHWTIQPDITVKGVDGNADITLTGSIDTKTER